MTFTIHFLRHFASPEPYEVFPDFIPFVEKIKSNQTKLAVISNYDKRLPPVLKKLGLSHYFDKIITSEEAKMSKPDSAIFHFCQNECGAVDFLPEEILHIGDDIEKDYKGARNVNWNSLVIKRNQNNDYSSMVFSPGHICNSFEEVFCVIQTPELLLPDK